MQTEYKLEDEKIKITKYNKNKYAVDCERGKFILWIDEKELKELRDKISEALDPSIEDEDIDILREKDDYIDEIGNGNKSETNHTEYIGDENDGEI